MINSLSRIKKFGVFDDYAKPAGLNEFGAVNIIYGWNYSGKTTLSRLFQCLETKVTHPDYPGAQFALVGDDGSSVNQSNVGAYGGVARVFNSDFIEKNLNWNGATFHPILLLGEDTIEAQNKIAANVKLIERCRMAYAKHRRLTDETEQRMSQDRTAEAKQIKIRLSLVEAFTASHLNGLLASLDAGKVAAARLSEENLAACLKQALASDKDKLEPMPFVRLQPTLSGSIAKCTPLLQRVPQLSSTIEYLRENPAVANWVEHGLTLHSDAKACEFCGGELTSERMGALRAHFSKDLLNFKNELSAAKKSVDSLQLELTPLQKSSFYPDFRAQAGEAHQELLGAVGAFNDQVLKLSASMTRKLASSFEGMELPELSDEPERNVARRVAAFNEIVAANNAIGESFGKLKASAVKKAKLHFAAEFFAGEHDSGVAKRLALHVSHREKMEKIGKALKAENLELEAQISLAQKGREKINARISNLLGSDELHIEVVKEGESDRFRLARREAIAKNLSEGEKTAIAFAFFLTKLDELEDFSKSLVYIDDPISSLDSNHIFQVNSIIRETFFKQDEPKGEWKIACAQIFISTHNFEFFSLLRELPAKSKRRYFQTKKLSPTVSTFTNLPASILKYSSEYHYLFSVIHNFHNSADKGELETLLSVPNAVRRFVELYSYARIPHFVDGTVDQRVDTLFGKDKSKRILKVLHYFSHLNDIERLSKNTDLICDIEHVVADLFELLEKDPLHYDALKTSLT
ncbi:AAA family ATPase [Paraburkholderia sediminicola]|uniref:AAA family ATPase n=1 Tax=Paraburkholderia sediminicola TaxID=458836 RepID=UPI0038B8E00C